MRTIAVMCTLLALVSCGGGNKESQMKEKGEAQPQQKPFGGGDTNSPIIISDGSMRINHGHHFQVRGGKKAILKLQNFTPRVLGYQCDPFTAGSCTSTCNVASPTSRCSVDLNLPNPWSLVLTASADGATLSYPGKADDNTNDGFRIDIVFNNKIFKIDDGKKPDGTKRAGVDLFQDGKLQSALLTVGASSYTFSCPSNTDCLQIAVVCPLGASCSQDQ